MIDLEELARLSEMIAILSRDLRVLEMKAQEIPSVRRELKEKMEQWHTSYLNNLKDIE